MVPIKKKPAPGDQESSLILFLARCPCAFLSNHICSGSYTTMRAKEPKNNPGGTIMLQIEVLLPYIFLTSAETLYREPESDVVKKIQGAGA